MRQLRQARPFFVTMEFKMEIQEKLRERIATAAQVEPGAIHLEHPSDLLHGDIASNIALVLAKAQKENPKALAEKIVRHIVQHQPEEVERVEVAGAGFINFYLSREFFTQSVQEALEVGEQWGRNSTLTGKKIMVEYTDPNPFKEFHIGHLVPNIIGEAIARLLEGSGAEVRRASYQGDVGRHVAQALWGALQGEPPKTVAGWGAAYARGSKAFGENEAAKAEIIEINKKIYERSDERITVLYEAGKKLSLESFEAMYARLGTKFDFYFFESESGPVGKKLVVEYLGKVFEESDGAVIFRGEKKGLHTRVFLNAEGLPTYEAKDLGLALLKHTRWPHEVSISVTGNEQSDYFKVMQAALAEINPELAKKMVHIGNGLLRLPTGKMSSRTGEVVTAEWLVDEVSKKVRKKMSERFTVSEVERPAGNEDDIINAISVGAIKYTILKQAVGGDIVFDFEKSVSFEGDSGPYLQYAATRAKSVLEKAQTNNQQPTTDHPTREVTEIERLLYRFPEIVERAGKEYAPHLLVTFLIQLAGAFNSWYAKEKIIDDTPESAYKLALTKALHQTMVNGLWLLGIKTPEKM